MIDIDWSDVTSYLLWEVLLLSSQSPSFVPFLHCFIFFKKSWVCKISFSNLNRKTVLFVPFVPSQGENVRAVHVSLYRQKFGNQIGKAKCKQCGVYCLWLFTWQFFQHFIHRNFVIISIKLRFYWYPGWPHLATIYFPELICLHSTNSALLKKNETLLQPTIDEHPNPATSWIFLGDASGSEHGCVSKLCRCTVNILKNMYGNEFVLRLVSVDINALNHIDTDSLWYRNT